MAASYAGYQCLIYYGTAGTTAATQITNATDVEYNLEPQYGDTTVRGAGSAVPINTSKVVSLKPTVTFTYVDKASDSTLAALLAAAAAGSPVAIRTKNYSSGKGYDGDCVMSVRQGAPLNGIQTYAFTCEAEDSARTPQLWV